MDLTNMFSDEQIAKIENRLVEKFGGDLKDKQNRNIVHDNLDRLFDKFVQAFCEDTEYMYDLLDEKVGANAFSDDLERSLEEPVQEYCGECGDLMEEEDEGDEYCAECYFRVAIRDGVSL